MEKIQNIGIKSACIYAFFLIKKTHELLKAKHLRFVL